MAAEVVVAMPVAQVEMAVSKALAKEVLSRRVFLIRKTGQLL